MSEELKEFNINLEDVKESNNLFDNLHEAIEKMRLHTLSDRFEVVLNNNLIESKEKLTNFRTILGCRISYDNLDKNISFIVREDNKPSYEELENKIDRLNKEYERIYNENCKLREKHNINDITLLDENERLNRIIDNIFKFMQNKYDNSDLTGFTISFMELQDLKALKENNK